MIDAVCPGQSPEAQPIDGWNVLRAALDPSAGLGEPISVTIRRSYEDGTETTENLDILGLPIGDAPELLQPGNPPEDPVNAAAESLRALRVMYDLSDVYSDRKRDFVENPDGWEVMRKQWVASGTVRRDPSGA